VASIVAVFYENDPALFKQRGNRVYACALPSEVYMAVKRSAQDIFPPLLLAISTQQHAIKLAVAKYDNPASRLSAKERAGLLEQLSVHLVRKMPFGTFLVSHTIGMA
jgi:hypothetical protein